MTHKKTGSLLRSARAFFEDPKQLIKVVKKAPFRCQARAYAGAYHEFAGDHGSHGVSSPSNPLWDYFESHEKGPGIWKWDHYFEIYHRHFSSFIGKKPQLLEVGIYSGGSLEMWRSYFGPGCRIHGVDIEESCRAYEREGVDVHIGDQADRGFWKGFKDSVGGLDIVIDDGGHTPEQQRVTMEEILPCLNPGGVYVCEDVHGEFNAFTAYVTSLVDELNRVKEIPGECLVSDVTPFQSSIHSLHFYPYVVVIEKRSTPQKALKAPRRGTEWQPFFDKTKTK